MARIDGPVRRHADALGVPDVSLAARPTLGILRRLRDVLPPDHPREAGMLLMMLAGAIAETIGVGAIPLFVAVLSGAPGDAGPKWAGGLVGGVGLEAVPFWGWAVVLLLIFSAKNLYLGLLAAVQARYSYRQQSRIATRLFKAYLETSWAQLTQRSSAQAINQTAFQAMEIGEFVLLPSMMVVSEVLVALCIAAFILWAEPLASLVAILVFVGTSAAFLAVVRERLDEYSKVLQERRAKMISAVQDCLAGGRVIRILGLESHFSSTFEKAVSDYGEAACGHRVVSTVPRLFFETAAVLTLIGVAALLLMQGRPVAGVVPTLTLFAIAAIRLMPSVNRVTASITSIRFGARALDDVRHTLERLEGDAPGRPVSTPNIEFREGIRVECVSFRYASAGEDVLTDVSIEIEAGRSTGIVGPSGAGKSTFVDLLVGLLSPTRGRILVGGMDLRGRERAWQRYIAYVPQDVFMADDSIRRNIAFGVPDAQIDDSRVRALCEVVQLSSWISELPRGLDTRTGECGSQLSGGERQRLAIARALYHDAEVLVMDEATSAVDLATEARILSRIRQMRAGRTTIVVAHRLATVDHCDRILHVEGGRVGASGERDVAAAVGSK